LEAPIWTYIIPILGFAALVLVGILIRKTRIVKSEDSVALNNIVLYVTMPAFVFSAIYKAQFEINDAILATSGWLLFPVILGLAVLLTKALRLSKPMAGAFILCVVWGNTGYLGLPLAKDVFGLDSVPYAMFYDVFNTAITIFAVGVPIAAYFASSGEKKLNPAIEVLKMPAIWAFVLALCMRAVPIPDAIIEWLSALGSTTAPIIMIAIGMSLSLDKLRGNVKIASIIVFVKLIAGPLILFAITTILIDNTVAQQVLVLEASAPCATLAVVIGNKYGLDDSFIATTVFLSVICCALTIPLLQILLF
jgi:predicted permease